MIHWPIVDIQESFFMLPGILTASKLFSADGTAMDDEKENDMENFINNAPFALVLVFLVIGFVLLIQGCGFFCGGKFKRGKETACPGHYYRTYHCGNGNIASGNGGQCIGRAHRQQ